MYNEYMAAPESRDLLFLHGWGVLSRAYSPVTANLSQRGWHVIAPDLYANHDETPNSIPSVAKKLEGDLTEKTWLAGHSMGAATAIHLASRNPEKIHGLALVFPAGSPTKNVFGHITDTISAARDLLELMEYLHLVDTKTLTRDPINVIKLGFNARHTNIIKDLHEVLDHGIPVSVCVGTQDSVVNATHHAKIPGVEAEFVEEDHAWPFRKPIHCAQWIHESLTTMDRAASARPRRSLQPR